jgi:hypothetical protein
MALRVVLGVCAIVVAVSATAGAAPARRPVPTWKVVLAAIDRQAKKGHLDPADAARYRAVVRRTVNLADGLPPAREALLRSQLAQAAALAPKLTAPRALAIFGQLAVNDDWLAHRGIPDAQTDVTDADGVLYRFFPGLGFEFHPLGAFGALNAVAASGDVEATAKLATALAARAVPGPGGGSGFEYDFNYAGGRAPWVSGFAQAVAAQAFARAASVDIADAPTLLAAARSAYRAIPGRLVRQTAFGPWIKLYGFSRDVVLNAQLQSALSLGYYAKHANDTGAAALAAGLQTAAARALPSFSTGYWSYYQLPGDPSPLNYQDYVVQLLQTISRVDDRFAAAAAEFAGFLTDPPAFRLADTGVGEVTFWVSKPSTVRISALGGVRRLDVNGGWHTVGWALPERAGIFPVTIHATDWAGNSASADALPIVHVAAPPKPKKHAKPHRKVTSAVAASLPPLLVGAGLDQPTQAGLATGQGFGALRMTLLWPAGASTPDPGAISALQRLPSGADLVLELYATQLPADDAGRSALAAYAATVAAQVPGLRDLIVGPAPTTATAAMYEAALAAVYDAVRPASPLVRVDGTLDGGVAPKASLAALAAAYRSSLRPAPLMDELAFTPAPAAGKNLWPLASLPTLASALRADFAGTAEPGASLPLIVDGLATATTSSADEPAQAAAYTADLQAVACRQDVAAVILARLVDSLAPGASSGLFSSDGTPKSSLQAVAQAVATAQSPTRGCPTASTSPPPPPAPTTTTSTTPTTPTTTTTPVKTAPPPPAPRPAKVTHIAVAAPDQLRFPAKLSTVSPPSVHLGCLAACLYLVTLQRADDGAPVLARRGAIAHAGSRTVTLPKARIKAGDYRLAVWTVAASDPGPVTVDRSPVVSAG